jgi:DNA-binding response OmpR family regulator
MPCVLVVDDEPGMLDLVTRALEQEGHTVIPASSGIEAVEVAKRRPLDLVILDIIMPGMDGIQVCKIMREDPGLASVPILFLTAKGMIEDKLAAFDAGGDDYLTKPFDLRELLARVQVLIRRSRRMETPAEPVTTAPPSRRETAPPTVAEPGPPFVLQVFALGPAKVLRDGELITSSQWESATTKEMFFLFLEHPEGLRREQVLEIMWRDASPERANSNFHSTLHRLRRALSKDSVIHEDGWYRLHPRLKYEYDVETFERELNLAAGLKDDPERAAVHLQRAIELYHGDFLEEFFSDWPFFRREALRNRFISALVALGDIRAQQGEHARALELYLDALNKDPYHEDCLRKVMGCYTLMGNRSKALAYYQRWRELYEADLESLPKG